MSVVRAELQRDTRGQGFDPVSIVFNEVDLGNRRFLKYIYERWARHRLELWRFTYVLDYNDPIAESRNSAVVATIERAASLSRGPGHR